MYISWFSGQVLDKRQNYLVTLPPCNDTLGSVYTVTHTNHFVPTTSKKNKVPFKVKTNSGVHTTKYTYHIFIPDIISKEKKYRVPSQAKTKVNTINS